MDQGLSVVIGMSVTYLFSVAGLVCAYYYYKKNQKNRD